MKDNLAVEVNELVVNVFNTISKIEEAKIKKMFQGNLSVTEVHTLDAIGVDEPKKMSEVALSLMINVSTLTTAIDKLVKKGYVKRFRDDEDRRIVNIALTEAGIEALKKHDILHARLIKTILSGLEEDEKEVFIKALCNLNSYFKRLYERRLNQLK